MLIANMTIEKYTNDAVILTAYGDPIVASQMLLNQLNKLRIWFKLWKVKVNSIDSSQILQLH